MSPRLSVPKPRADIALHPMDREIRRLAQIRTESLHVMMGLATVILGAHLLAIVLLVCL
ncbi:hypothetical protein [Azorhizobium doebereinerae]|uniref:hypothetical protein n=1 Tax=Azorhizobium doebereinerae TaxID=281091 RepID=UPI0012EC1BF5|nr:hypothetical protein [Azorhizobium doebereinerae]